MLKNFKNLGIIFWLIMTLISCQSIPTTPTSTLITLPLPATEDSSLWPTPKPFTPVGADIKVEQIELLLFTPTDVLPHWDKTSYKSYDPLINTIDLYKDLPINQNVTRSIEANITTPIVRGSDKLGMSQTVWEYPSAEIAQQTYKNEQRLIPPSELPNPIEKFRYDIDRGERYGTFMMVRGRYIVKLTMTMDDEVVTAADWLDLTQKIKEKWATHIPDSIEP